MKIGLLWHDKDGFQEQKAVAAYIKRIGETPNTVYTGNTNIACLQLIVKRADNMPENHYFIVKEDCNEVQKKAQDVQGEIRDVALQTQNT